MNNEIWLSIEEVSALTEEIKETVRRKCKREEYVSTFTKNGRFKVYSILLSSLPLEYQNRYLQKDSKNEEQIIDISDATEEYALAPLWARKQADKYMLLINQTKNMRYKEILEFNHQVDRVERNGHLWWTEGVLWDPSYVGIDKVQITTLK